MGFWKKKDKKDKPPRFRPLTDGYQPEEHSEQGWMLTVSQPKNGGNSNG